jgi:hypothetical protein
MFEEFAYDYYEEQFPLGAASEFFFGRAFLSQPYSTQRTTAITRRMVVHITTAPIKICLRQFFNIMLEPSALMLNLHFKKPGHTHRHLITCSETNTEDCVLICYAN